MTNFDGASSARALLIGAAATMALAMMPTSASAGFFDQLFGGGTVTPAQPSYNYQPQQASPDLQDAPIKHRSHAKRVAVQETPVRQKTTDLWHDKTLRPGDAIMMKDGLHVFRGYSAALHTPKEFVLMSGAKQMPSKERSELLAMDTTRNDPLRSSLTPDTIASGRSAAVAVPISQGVRITDARGASVRYVGP